MSLSFGGLGGHRKPSACAGTWAFNTRKIRTQLSGQMQSLRPAEPRLEKKAGCGRLHLGGTGKPELRGTPEGTTGGKPSWRSGQMMVGRSQGVKVGRWLILPWVHLPADRRRRPECRSERRAPIPTWRPLLLRSSVSVSSSSVTPSQPPRSSRAVFSHPDSALRSHGGRVLSTHSASHGVTTFYCPFGSAGVCIQ